MSPKTGTEPSNSGHTLPGETRPLPDRAQGINRELPWIIKKKKKKELRIVYVDSRERIVFDCINENRYVYVFV